MNTQIFINSKFVETIGWTLLHSLWQIALVAFVLFVLLKLLRGFPANFRYWLSVFALVFAVALPVFAFYQLNKISPTAFSGKEISKTGNSKTFNKQFYTPGNFTIQNENTSELTKEKISFFFGSLKNLQSYFSKNLSAILPFLVGFWFVGILIFSLRLIGGFWQLHIFRTRELFAPDRKWQDKFSELCKRLKIRQTVELFNSALVETPVVIGFLKPVVLIPVSVFLQISPHELETIIAHELVHIRRCDALVNFAQSFVEVLFFYHPFVWWMSSVIRIEREFAADESVVKILENSQIVYANALANLEELRHLTNQKITPLATAANGGNLMQRISKILQKNTGISGRKTVSLWSAVAALALISAFLLTVFSFNNSPVVNADNKPKT
ncbi:MAG: M56 family metallopeptidase, partial [Pyrinomonadaceae bacterium]